MTLYERPVKPEWLLPAPSTAHVRLSQPHCTAKDRDAISPLDTRYPDRDPRAWTCRWRPAGLVPRALAFGFDLGLRGLVMGILVVPLALFGNIGIGIRTLLLFLVSWWYMVLFEVLTRAAPRRAGDGLARGTG